MKSKSSSWPAWALVIIMVVVQVAIWLIYGKQAPAMALGLFSLSASILMGTLFAWLGLSAEWKSATWIPVVLLVLDHIIISRHDRLRPDETIFRRGMSEFVGYKVGSFEGHVGMYIQLVLMVLMMALTAYCVAEIMHGIQQRRRGGGGKVFREAWQNFLFWEKTLPRKDEEAPRK